MLAPIVQFITAFLIAAGSLAVTTSAAAADGSVGTTFTYQGRLTEGGEPAAGTVELIFRLYDEQVGGTPLKGGVLVAEDFEIGDDGRFTIDLDFGDLFTGEPRWLEIVVNETTLAPRQPIMAAPHAMVATTATNVPTTAIVGSYEGINSVGTLDSLNVSGNTGLGTVNPAAKLHIVGSDNNGTDAAVRIVSGNQTMLLDGNEIDTTDAGGLHLNHNLPNNVSIVNGGGRVGIGTQFPAARLDVRALAAASGDNTARFSAPEIGPNVSHIHWGTNGDWFIRSANSAGKIILQDGGGNVGIGTTSPTARLHVNHVGSGYAMRAVHDANQSGGAILAEVQPDGNTQTHYAGRFVNYNFNGSGTSEIGISAELWGSAGAAILAKSMQATGNVDGVVGVTLSNSSQASGVEGRAEHSSGLAVGVKGFCNSATGYDFLATGAGVNYGSSSSARWKRNVASITQPLEKLDRLRGVTFDWDAEHGGHHDIGMIAEEVGRVLPEIVVYEENGIDAQGMDYSKLGPLLIEAVKALRTEKEAEVARLEARVEMLEARLRRFEEIAARAAGHSFQEN